MAQLIVRNLAPEVVAELRKQAARNGRSAEAEHREILRAALARGGKRRTLKQLLGGMPSAGRDDDFARVPQRPRRVRV
jgi:antitoxin FitA